MGKTSGKTAEDRFPAEILPVGRNRPSVFTGRCHESAHGPMGMGDLCRGYRSGSDDPADGVNGWCVKEMKMSARSLSAKYISSYRYRTFLSVWVCQGVAQHPNSIFAFIFPSREEISFAQPLESAWPAPYDRRRGRSLLFDAPSALSCVCLSLSGVPKRL